MASLNVGNGFRLDGIDANDISGTSVSGIGDVNGDGLDDLLIGAYKADLPGGDGSARRELCGFWCSQLCP